MCLDLDTDNLHHAYLIAGPVEKGTSAVESFLKEALGLRLAGNPDFVKVQQERLGIDAARKLRSAQQRKGFAAKRKIFLVAFLHATPEAQNGLLKSLEEPTEGTHFFVITPNTKSLLPTLLSRVEEVQLDSSEDVDQEMKTLAETFLTKAPPERISLVSDIVDSNDTVRASDLLDALEEALHVRLNEIPQGRLEDLLKAQRYISNAGASVKQLLHNLAMVLPHVESDGDQ